MKRVFAIALALMLVVALTCTAAFADGSKSSAIDVTVDGHPATGIGESNVTLTEPEAAAAIGADAKDLRVVWEGDVRQTPPANLSWRIPGAAAVYAFQYNGSRWELIASAEGAGLSCTLNAKGPVAVVIRLPKSAPTSPKTGMDVSVFAAFALAAVAAASAVSVARKKQ